MPGASPAAARRAARDRLGLAVGPRPAPRPAVPAGALGDGEDRLGRRTPCLAARPRARTRALRRADAREGGVVAVGLRRPAPAPAGRPNRPPARHSPPPSSGLVLNSTSSGIFAFARRSRSPHHSSGRYSAHPNGSCPPPPDRVHRHADLAVPDLPQRPRVLTLHPRRVLPVLREPRVVKHPRLHTEPGATRSAQPAPPTPDPTASRPGTAAPTRTAPASPPTETTSAADSSGPPARSAPAHTAPRSPAAALRQPRHDPVHERDQTLTRPHRRPSPTQPLPIQLLLER